MERESRQPRADGSECSAATNAPSCTTNTADPPQPGRLPRRLLRKIVVEPVGEGWRARIVGFDARWNGGASRTFASRHMAVEAAKAASRQTGLPVVTIETITAPDGPRAA
jgi:hypothetical protein